MKIIKYISLMFIGSTLLLCCRKYNASPPGSQLTGALLYKGDSIGVQYNRVPFQLYQFGFGQVGPIEGAFAQDGSLHALLFDGDYKLVIPLGQGPFLSKKTASGDADTIAIKMKGNQTVNIEVTPYYMIRNAQFSGGGGKVNATFKVEKIVTDANAKDIEKVSLYINRTDFATETSLAVTNLSGTSITDPNNITLSVNVPAFSPGQGYVFARVGVKMVGVEDMIFSPTRKINY